MHTSQKVTRWIGAIGITLAPFLLFVLPALMYPADGYDTGEEQYRAIANGTGGGYPGQLVQIAGSVFFLAAVLAIGIFTIVRGRARVIGATSLGIGMAASVALLPVMGYELAMMTILVSATDVERAVALVADIVAGPTFIILLAAALFGFFLSLPLLAFALWRSRVVPIVVPLLFALPVLIGFLPLPFDASLLSSFLFVAPCVWMTVNLIRAVPRASMEEPADSRTRERRSHARA